HLFDVPSRIGSPFERDPDLKGGHLADAHGGRTTRRDGREPRFVEPDPFRGRIREPAEPVQLHDFLHRDTRWRRNGPIPTQKWPRPSRQWVRNVHRVLASSAVMYLLSAG